YVINLLSQAVPIDFSKIAPVPIGPDQRLYSTVATVKGRRWHRLRIGFFKSESEAKRVLRELRHFYRGAWIDLASPEEKQTFFLRAEEAPKEPIRLPKIDEAAPADERLASMMETVRKVMTAGDYPRAIRLLTAVLEVKDSAYEKEALELLGLARERNGQFAHANAEYTKYLEKYPEGEDADRVRQRLAGLITAVQEPREKLRRPTVAERPEDDVPWEVYGSLGQFFREDRIESDFVDDEDSVTRRQIDTDLDVTARQRTDAYDMRFQFSGGHEWDLLTDGPGSEASLSAAYVDIDHFESNISARLGRQRFRSSGILNRFDGGVLGYRFDDDTKINVYAGVPVERSSDTFIREDKYFFGMNAELNSLFEDIDITLFGIEQRVEGLVDRRAIGAEARYFDDKRSVFGLIDYDLHYGELNTFLLQTNWTVRDDLRLYANYDYRTSPILTTSNALQGQVVSSIESLQDSFTDQEIFDLAEDRTATSQVFSLGGTWSYTQDLQFSGDVTLSRISDTPASGGVEATEETGNELFYTAQVIKNNLFKQGDIGIFSLRYADTMSSDTVTMTANSRYPITNLWRIKPRFTVSYRENKDNDDTRLQLGALLQTEYRYRNDLIFEFEAGANWFDESSSTAEEDFIDYFFGIGYRWTF
ncbi:MAG: SPOR domain-containing protein, partial [Chromatiales bacterium]|nr:SPOR domain-containing protein [Chromatiales bacterium]